MELSYFLAQLMGLSLIIFAAVGILRPRIVRDAISTFESNTLTSLFFGFASIVLGLAIILTHNIWEFSWVGVITLFGWAALLKGITFLLAPDTLLNFGTVVYKTDGSVRGVLFFTLLIGVYLAYNGFSI